MPIEIQGLTPLLQVFDMPVAVHFYCELLEFELVNTSQSGEIFDWALLRRGDANLMLNTAYEAEERPAIPDPVRVKAHGNTILYFDCRDLDEAFRQLREAGIDSGEPILRSYGMKQLDFHDPDGYALCFQWPASS